MVVLLVLVVGVKADMSGNRIRRLLAAGVFSVLAVVGRFPLTASPSLSLRPLERREDDDDLRRGDGLAQLVRGMSKVTKITDLY